jgi:caffeoyl-CoA O-methyltransferase
VADPDSRAGMTYGTPAIQAYLDGMYAPETPGMRDANDAARAAGLPQIQVGPNDGRIVEILLRLVGARKVVEIGTLAGYSAQWIARALPADGRLWTIERDPKHAEVARGALARAGLADRVTVLNGPAREQLATIESEGPFDAVFIDADKEGYPDYARWALRTLRPGGLVIGDNVYLFGYLAGREPDERTNAEAIRAMREFHELLAAECDGVVLPTPDGLSVAIKR